MNALTTNRTPSHLAEKYSQAGTAAIVMSTKEAGRYLALSHRTLEDWRLKGQGPRFVKWGRTVRYRLSDLTDFLSGESFSNTGEASRSLSCG